MLRRLDFGTPRTRHPNRHLGSGSGSNPLSGATLTVSLSSATPFINNNVTVTATLLDRNGNPLEGYEVTIAISGVNTASDTSATNASGQKTYTYQSTTAGGDVALATLVNDPSISDSENITWAINFLLNDKFTDTDPAPITLPRTATPTGTLTGSDASNLLSVGSGVLNVAADAGTPTVYLYDAQRPRVAGLAAMWSFNPLTTPTTMRWGWGWNSVNNQRPGDLSLIVGATNEFRVRLTANFGWNIGSLASNTPETIAIVLFSNRNEFYRLVSGSWKLVWVDYSITTANMYAGSGNSGQAITASTQANYRVAVLGAATTALYTQLVGNISAGATSAARNGNCLIAFDLDTLPTLGEILINFRKQDANNYWQMGISLTTATLREIVAGVPTNRASAVVTTGKFRIIADGTTISAYDDNAQLFSYASAANFQASTAIEINSLGTGGAISDMDIYDRYAVSVADANLDALAAG